MIYIDSFHFRSVPDTSEDEAVSCFCPLIYHNNWGCFHFLTYTYCLHFWMLMFFHIYIYIYIYTRSLNKFPDFFFVWALLLIVHTWNSSSLQSNLLQLQCMCCTIPTTSGKPHGSPLVWACQWPSSQPLSSSQLSHNDSLWA